MRTLLVWCFLLACAPAWAQSGQQRARAAGSDLVGTPAPRLVLKTIDGQTLDLGRLYGKQAVYLKFWATWCVPCREQMPHLERTFEQAGPNLAVIAINAGFDDTLADVQRYRRELGLKMPIVLDDGTLGQAFRLRVTPQHIVIGRDGRIQYVGHLADARLDAALAAAQAPAATVADAKGAPVDLPPIGIGDRVPALAASTLDGAPFRLRDGGRPTVLAFLSPWCETYLDGKRAGARPALAASCRAAREQVDALAQRHPDVRWLGVASGLWATPGELREYRKAYGVTIPLTLDAAGTWFRAFRVMHVPTLLLIDRQGRLARRLEGVGPQFEAELKALSAP
ncbi:TlpA family protein disulfide reductase [Mizugakiibacter sediminis]|uniref:Histidinol phosphatase n=1 Tax=Mizugakiibacter sediminis TaxID=1475481 RepID=A0A0U1PBA3_9GAMM|nr:TlpA disulfide reductase family protein [Mizugakiibacter sediminis]